MSGTAEAPTGAGPLSGKTILICGANGGLGEATVHACAKAGAQVVLLGRRIPRLTRLYDALLAEGAQEPAIYPLDLSGAIPQDYTTLAETLKRECGQLDAIVHCAAEFKGLASLENMPLEDWFTGLHVNLTAPFLLTRACLPLLRERDAASVLFLMDDLDRTSHAFWGSYGVAKQGLYGLIAILRDELANSPVRVHGVQPGPMRTNLRSRAYFAEDPGTVVAPEAYAPAIVSLLAATNGTSDETVIRLPTPPSSEPRSLGLKTFTN